MNQETSTDMTDELRAEYDLRLLLKGGERGTYSVRYRAGSNVARLDPDIAVAFPSDEAVNDALRLVMRMARIPVPAVSQPEPPR